MDDLLTLSFAIVFVTDSLHVASIEFGSSRVRDGIDLTSSFRWSLGAFQGRPFRVRGLQKSQGTYEALNF